MTTIMNCDGVLNLTKRLIDFYPDNLIDPTNYLAHLSDTYKIASETTNRALIKYPKLNRWLITEQIALAGGLHDIGRVLRKNQLFHELRGAKYIEDNGLEIGVADSIVNIYRIAQMFRSHYVVAEQFADEENAQERAEFEPLDSGLLIPRTWQEQIVTYSEVNNTSLDEKIRDMKKRYLTPEYNKTDPSLYRAIVKGEKRLQEINKRIQRLTQGKLSEEEIMRYGFL